VTPDAPGAAGFDFGGRVALVTGASGALGQVVARRVLAAGASLALPARRLESLSAAFPELRTAADRVFTAACDVTDPAAVDGFVPAAESRIGPLDFLVNVAGGFRYGAVRETSVETWDEMMRLNARAPFLLCRAALPGMLARGGGAIVTVASRAALAGDAGVAAYAASKAAAVRLTESLAAEVKAQGVRVNCVLPGTLDTPANRAAMPDADRRGWVELDAVADVILFLLSPLSRAIHGAAIPVYGLG
jgi:NAD(P)-dependent dehydrogenase (short-subunit alcohol dehydrogenase family)